MDGPFVSAAGLHAIVYCERLFYLEEVERIRIADARVYAGRRMHVELDHAEDEGTLTRHVFESESLGLQGTVDVLRRENGQIIPYEHKRGRSAGGRKARAAWETDRVQVAAYGLLAEEAFGQRITECRVRYHANSTTVRVLLDDELRATVRRYLSRARELRTSIERPRVTDDERKCRACSLAPACLPEEGRLAADPTFRPVRLLPIHPAGETLHVVARGARVGVSGEQLVVEDRGGEIERAPMADLGSVVLHGLSQISTQALRACADHDVQVHWMTFGGGLVGSLAPTAPSAQRHVRQLRALDQPEFAFGLARRLVHAKVDSQLRFLLRASRGQSIRQELGRPIAALRACLRRIDREDERPSLLGHEGSAASEYFGSLSALISEDIDPRLTPSTRTRRPPLDRFSALLGYGYGSLYREVLAAIVAVGLHPGVGFYHQLRSSAHPLALDVMELFRVPLVDMPVIAALNRQTFDAEADFDEVPERVLLSERGRTKLIEILERRRRDVWRHDVVGYSLSYARIVELEVRLLEKEWTGEPGLFARLRLR
ncbi:MAG TPA: type I-MYXAN CRISPR-associated endonuclease Cas1 [Vicinamibacterales bacterium]|jgi:CRISPR-associated protein Cas1|nr:type I-MYXAN CRISPR-associated endonuclease Cas1 [Vicinamibacterales bacterium]